MEPKAQTTATVTTVRQMSITRQLRKKSSSSADTTASIRPVKRPSSALVRPVTTVRM